MQLLKVRDSASVVTVLRRAGLSTSLTPPVSERFSTTNHASILNRDVDVSSEEAASLALRQCSVMTFSAPVFTSMQRVSGHGRIWACHCCGDRDVRVVCNVRHYQCSTKNTCSLECALWNRYVLYRVPFPMLCIYLLVQRRA